MAFIQRAQQIIQHLLSGDRPAFVGEETNELLGYIFRGFSVESLRPLLRSENDETVASGLFILSEIGIRALPLFGEAARFVNHPEPAFRIDAAGIVCCCADGTIEDSRTVASVLKLAEDAIFRVQLAAVGLLCYGRDQQLVGALNYFRSKEPRSEYIPYLEWFVSNPALLDAVEKYRSPFGLRKVFAQASIARAARSDFHILEQLMKLNDSSLHDLIPHVRSVIHGESLIAKRRMRSSGKE